MPNMTKKSDDDVDLDLRENPNPIPEPMEVLVAEEAGSYRETKTIYRAIGVSGDPQSGVFTSAEVDDYVSSYQSGGWTLFTAQCIGTGGEGSSPVIHMVYVLVR